MRYLILSTALVSSLIAATAPLAAKEIKLKPIIDARLRFEGVDQAGPAPLTSARDAEATTLRLRAGVEAVRGPFSALVEAEGLLALGPDYNSGVNGKTSYPIVPDGQNIDINRAQLQYKTKQVTLTAGRQRINLDDQRFVGSVAWRQNEQTFDSVRAEITAVKDFKLDMIYAWSARTIWGVDGGYFDGATPVARLAHINGDNLFINASYKFKPGTLTGFAYKVDQDMSGRTPNWVAVNTFRNSSMTYGGRFTGTQALSKTVKLGYLASYATQSDDGRNPIGYTADYLAGELSLEAKGFKLTGGYEKLGSDAGATGLAGGFAFQTPYATLHKFNGWADKFLTTPQTGLQDVYVGLAKTFPKVGSVGPVVANITWHQFSSDRNGIHYGDELNAQVTVKVSKRVNALVKYADYQRDGTASFPGDADTRKIWLEIAYAY